MSLINEALRKARKEAAERDAEQRGVTYRPPRAHLPAERSLVPALVGVAFGALIAAAAFFFFMPRPSSETATEAGSTPLASEAATAASDPEGADVADTQEAPKTSEPSPTELVPAEPVPSKADPAEPDPADPVPTEPAQTVPAQTETAQTGPDESPALSEPTPKAAEAPEPEPLPGARIAEARRVQPPEQVGQVGEQTYVLEAEIGGVSLRLDFIVWAPANPFAQINGRQVAVGQTVDGFLVRSITRDEVTLEGDDGPIRLRVR